MISSTRDHTCIAGLLPLVVAAGSLLAAPVSAADSAADSAAGAELATQCIACHGPMGISTADDIPNLAAQKTGYVDKQLRAFRTGERENALMNAIAASLSDADIENLASHFSGLAGVAPGATAEDISGLDGSLPGFPKGFDSEFTRYQTIDFEDRKQVRHYWGNEPALAAAAAGEDFPEGAYLLVEIVGAETDDTGQLVKGDDGSLVATERVAFTAMEKRAGWGDDVPPIVRNGDWGYAVFSVDGEHQDGVNEAACLACHKPLTDTDYSFTYEAMATAGK